MQIAVSSVHVPCNIIIDNKRLKRLKIKQKEKKKLKL